MKVSVIIPTYNHYAELKRCLASLFKQTVQDLEIIVVNDGSTDETAAFLAMQKNINVITLTVPAGTKRDSNRAAIARNAGARTATGEYLFFCDADVQLRRSALKTLADTLDANPNSGFAYCSFIWGWRWFRAVPFDAQRLRRHNFISTMSMVRRVLFPGFDESLPRFQDWDLWLRITAQGISGSAVRKTLFRVTRHAGEISHRAETYATGLARIKSKHNLTEVDL